MPELAASLAPEHRDLLREAPAPARKVVREA
jgi:hypothetical protein